MKNPFKYFRWSHIPVLVVITFIWCEYLIYYAVLWQCTWPAITTSTNSKDQHPTDKPGDELKVVFISDTHLLGPYRGHWFDKLRREWQMHRSFVSAMQMLKPDIIFFLGDLFDEGRWVTDEGFQAYRNRFMSLFPTENNTKVFVVPGNHDMGFHYELFDKAEARFNQAFRSRSVQLISERGINFVLINSMAMQQDGCTLCYNAEVRLKNLATRFQCEREPSSKRSCKMKHESSSDTAYSAPVILQHFPLYRRSDAHCEGADAAPYKEKDIIFRETWECLSKRSSKLILESLKPRLVMSGHTHHGCVTLHTTESLESSVEEHSVPSFSWRNRNNPSFYLGSFSLQNHALAKCYLPKESSVVILYFFNVCVVLCALVRPLYNGCCRFSNRGKKKS